MSIINHEAIIITSNKEQIQRLYKIAKSIFKICPVSRPTREAVNLNATFTVCPDGSGESYETSKKGDKEREQFMSLLMKYKSDHGYYGCEWVWISYGNDKSCVIADNNNPL
jgi:hypothetical protein